MHGHGRGLLGVPLQGVWSPDPALQHACVLSIPSLGPPLVTGPWGHSDTSSPARSAVAGLTGFIPFKSFGPLDESRGVAVGRRGRAARFCRLAGWQGVPLCGEQRGRK